MDKRDFVMLLFVLKNYFSIKKQIYCNTLNNGMFSIGLFNKTF